MDCPPPLSSEDEDDDFGDFHTVFEKSVAAEGGSIKSRINLDIPISPLEGNASSSFMIPSGPAAFSVESNSPPPELPPSLPMSPETPDVDFFAAQDARRISPVIFSSNFKEESAPSDIPSPKAEKKPNFLFQNDSFSQIASTEENGNVVNPQNSDIFASFATPEQPQSFDTEFGIFNDSDAAVNVESHNDEFSTFSAFEECSQDKDVPPECTPNDSTDMEADVDTSLPLNTVDCNTKNTDSHPGTEEDTTQTPDVTVTHISEDLFDEKQSNSTDVTTVPPSVDKEFVPNFDIVTPSPLPGETSVFSWDSGEENVEAVDNDINVNKEARVKQVDEEQADKLALFTDETEDINDISSDQFASFSDFDSVPATDVETSSFPNKADNLQETEFENHSRDPASPSNDSDFHKFAAFEDEEDIAIKKLDDDSNEDVGFFADEETNMTHSVEAEGFVAFSQSDEDISNDFGDFPEPEQKLQEQIPDFPVTKNYDDKMDTDEFADFATENANEFPKEASDDDNFGNFADFGAQSDDDFSDFADFKEPDDTEFGDFGDFDSKVPASSTSGAVDDDFDNDFDDFADFGSAAQEPPPPAVIPSHQNASEPLTLEKMLHQCYGGNNTDEENETNSAAYNDGQLFMCKVHEVDAQFAIGTKWLSTPSFNTQVTTLCLSSNSVPQTSSSSSSSSKPTQEVIEDEFSVFGTVDTSNKLSDDSGLLPEDLSESRPPAPAPSKKHAAILSGYKKEEAKKLSPEAAAIVESLPDLTFMLSSVLMFPVKAS